MHIKRHCPHCGKPIIEGTIFCLDCGAKILGDKPTAGGDRLGEERSSFIGYDAEDDSLPPGSHLLVVEGVDRGLSFALNADDGNLIGRRGAAVALKDPFVSRRHAEIREEGGTLRLYDLNSANCTLVNSRPIDRHELRDGDLIEIGYTTLLFRVKT